MWQHQVPGTPLVDRLLGPGGPELAGRIGRAAASITRSGLQPGAVFGAAAQLDRSRRAAADLGSRVPRLAPVASCLLSRLTAAHAAAGALPHRPIHGAPHPNQWLEDGPTLGLVDFDRLSTGDPELDVATFLGELDFEETRVAPVDELEQAFLAGYEAIAGTLDRALLAAYRSHKRLAKSLRSARALRPDGDERAERHLEQAMECIV
jgi:aminoglycoside phosphotransferase (APT) family kinase protein